MSRLRVVNGDLGSIRRSFDEINALVPPAMTREEAARIAAASMTTEITTGCLSDPAGMVIDAEGRFTDIEVRHVAKAKRLITENVIEDGRFTIPGLPDLDLVIVLHPTQGTAKGVNDEDIMVDRYMVFTRERGGNGEVLDTPYDCYVCNNAASRNKRALPHKCWRLRPPRPNMVPMRFAWAHGVEDAEDLCKEIRSAWQADREQEVGTTDWGAQMEIPFSSDWLAGYQTANPKAWSTLAVE